MKFLGWREEWLRNDEEEFAIKGERYNGRATLYIFWIPVWVKGFRHSTWLE